VERVAVITDIHANLPALEAVLAAIESTDVDAVYCGGDLVGYRPHPNEVCALIEERGIRRSTATTTTPSPAISRIAAAPTATATTASSANVRSSGRSPTPTGAPRTSWADSRSTSASTWAPTGYGSSMGRRAGSTSTCSPTSRPARSSGSRRGRTATCSSSVTPICPGWRGTRGAVVNCGSVGKPKDGDPRAAFALLALDEDQVVAEIERVDYDAGAVARQLAAAGLPGEYAEKLVLAA
jgi:hypothetical protein